MLTTHNKMLEAQIAQQATSSSKPSVVDFLVTTNLALGNNVIP